MPTLVMTDAFVSINSVDLSNRVKTVTIDYSAEMLDDTAMGTAGTRTNLGGLKDWSMSVEFNQDYAASTVDITLFAIVGSAVPIIVRPVKATAVSATNPNYSATGVVENYQPINGNVGSLATAPVSIKPAGVLTRATS